jgi:hypothetical protein
MKHLKKGIIMLLLAGGMLMLGACHDDSHEDFPDLAEGTYSLKIYAGDKLIFERQGDAFGTGSEPTLRLDDPEFGTEPSDFDKFAMLLINTSRNGELSWQSKGDWRVQSDSMPVFIRQRFYSAPDDWSYKGTSGYVKINEASEGHIKGSFRIDMQVDDGASISPNFHWTANPQWGEHITIAGYFHGTHY